MESLKNTGTLRYFRPENPDARPRSPEEWSAHLCDNYNELEGSTYDKNEYDCPLCKNKGIIMFPRQEADGVWTEVTRPCECLKKRKHR